jgi:hypothetical protein
MKRARFFLAAALLIFATLLSIGTGYSFDIAIYQDPVGMRYWEFLIDCRNGYRLGTTRWSDSVGWFPSDAQLHAEMDSVYHWYQQMRVDYVMTIMPYDTLFNYVPVDTGMNIKVLNFYMPGGTGMTGFKYVDSQSRG